MLNTKLFQALAPTSKCNAARLQTLCFILSAIKALTMDREFIGKKWRQW
ncbi:MAG: hypothetical protein QNL33_07185 [Akkermansiaceae bacterium]